MGKRHLYLILFLAIGGICIIAGCIKKDNTSEPLEPISLIQPDSVMVQHFAGDAVPIQIKFTADRPINFVQCLYDLGDTAGTSNYSPSFPDTLFNIPLAKDSPRVNIYTNASVIFTVPDSSPSFSKIYFKAFFTAGNSGFAVGQNYPAGIDSANKTFEINVR